MHALLCRVAEIVENKTKQNNQRVLSYAHLAINTAYFYDQMCMGFTLSCSKQTVISLVDTKWSFVLYNPTNMLEFLHNKPV
jgi:hypothetical protein